MRGDIVTAPDGGTVTLVDVGTSVLLDTPEVRVWDVALDPGQTHPWHLHHNPYVVLSVAGSTGYMDWLEGRPRTDVREYSGGAVFRPVAPIHRLTNTGPTRYRNRLVELKALGEDRPEGVLDVGPGGRSVQGEVAGPALPDGRVPVLESGYVRIWLVETTADAGTDLLLDDGVPHVVAELDGELEGDDLAGSVAVVHGRHALPRDARPRTWFVVALDYLKENADD